MNNWNPTGKIKAAILVVCFLPNLFVPVPPFGDLTAFAIAPLVFGVVANPIIANINASVFGLEISRPDWNANPLNLRKPLNFFHFMAYFMIVIGISLILGTVIAFGR